MTCPSCGSTASGNFCSACGASLSARACSACRAELSPQARFCHRCGAPVAPRSMSGSDRKAWIIAGLLCVLLVGGIVYQVSSSAPSPAVPDMANPGSSGGAGERGPDISQMSPRERFDRLFNRIMQAAERGDAAEIERFTPMALGAYRQLDTRDVDARYHAAVIHLQGGGIPQARALADTILQESPGHLFGYIIRGTAAQMAGDSTAELRAERDFLRHYQSEMAANRVEYFEHRPVVEEFREKSGRSGKPGKS
jgi:Double zinc ribbon